jgi:hypothetical protein
MSYKNLITYNSKVSQVIQNYYSPSALIGGLPSFTIYTFLSKVDPWSNDSFPDQPTQDQQYLKTVFSNMFVAKRIGSSLISPVLQRIDWTLGTTYDYYLDNVDMFARDGNGFLLKQFYVRNNYDQVFKCLWNNNNKPSTSMPMFQPGAYGNNNIFTGSDGYRWKFMYNIDLNGKRKFMDANWIPVPAGSNVPTNPNNYAGSGDIEVINITNGGSGYDYTNTIIQITISGSNTSPATVNASSVVIDGNGSIVRLDVENSGKNYTSANVTINAYTSANLSIVSANATGATAIVPVSPIGGHGFNPISELGCNHVMYSVEFDGPENGYVPTDIQYYQVGLLVSPLANTAATPIANSSIYSLTTDFSVTSGYGTYVSDEIVYQGNSLQLATFTATVLSFDNANGIIKLINTKGNPTYSAPVFGNTSKTTRTLLSVKDSDLVPYSGYISYIENRSGIQRSSDGIEQFRFVVQY